MKNLYELDGSIIRQRHIHTHTRQFAISMQRLTAPNRFGTSHSLINGSTDKNDSIINSSKTNKNFIKLLSIIKLLQTARQRSHPAFLRHKLMRPLSARIWASQIKTAFSFCTHTPEMVHTILQSSWSLDFI